MFSDLLWFRAQPSVTLSNRELALMNVIKVVFPTMASLCVCQKVRLTLKYRKFLPVLSIWNMVIPNEQE